MQTINLIGFIRRLNVNFLWFMKEKKRYEKQDVNVLLAFDNGFDDNLPHLGKIS